MEDHRAHKPPADAAGHLKGTAAQRMVPLSDRPSYYMLQEFSSLGHFVTVLLFLFYETSVTTIRLLVPLQYIV